MPHSGVKQGHKSLVLSSVLANQPIARKDVARLCGISNPTVSIIVDELIANGLIVESTLGQSTCKGGRRPIGLTINQSSYYIIAVVLRLNSPMVALFDLMGNELETITHDNLEGGSTTEVISRIECDIGVLLDKYRSTTKFAGIGVSVPGIVKDNIIWECPELALENYDLATCWQSLFDLPVYVDKDVYAMSLGENWRGAGKIYSDFVTIYVGTGIGASVILKNNLHRGTDSMAGEIGYMASSEAFSRGPFTHRDFGYFESTSSMMWLEEAAHDSFKNIAQRARNGDNQMLAYIQNEANRLMPALSSIVCLLNPQAIIINGRFRYAEDLICDYLKSHLSILTPLECDIVFSKLGNSALTYGCVATVLLKTFELQFLTKSTVQFAPQCDGELKGNQKNDK